MADDIGSGDASVLDILGMDDYGDDLEDYDDGTPRPSSARRQRSGQGETTTG